MKDLLNKPKIFTSAHKRCLGLLDVENFTEDRIPQEEENFRDLL